MSVTLRQEIERLRDVFLSGGELSSFISRDMVKALELPDAQPIELVPESLTKREQFAMAALQGFCTRGYYAVGDACPVAIAAVRQADALIAALEAK